jgi:hypothetical protein
MNQHNCDAKTALKPARNRCAQAQAGGVFETRFLQSVNEEITIRKNRVLFFVYFLE